MLLGQLDHYRAGSAQIAIPDPSVPRIFLKALPLNFISKGSSHSVSASYTCTVLYLGTQNACRTARISHWPGLLKFHVTGTAPSADDTSIFRAIS